MLSRRDLRRYRPELRAPVVFESGKHTVYAAPPPSSGGVVIGQIFGVLEAAGVGALDHAGHLHTYIEASKHAFADRAKFLADPSSLDNIQSLLDREVFRARAANIQDLETLRPRALLARPPHPMKTPAPATSAWWTQTEWRCHAPRPSTCRGDLACAWKASVSC